NPDYTSIFAFNNDFPALAAVAPSHPPDLSPLFEETMETGVCEVMCYSPDHNRSMIHFSIDEIMAVIKAWQERYAELGSRPDISHVQIFETRGKEVGNSAPHPHCQIWAQKSIPSIPAQVVASQVEYFEKNSKPMMLEYVEQEMTRRVRLLYDTDTFAVVVPFWAEWPYELLILPKKIMQSLRELDDTSIKDLASCLA